MKALAFFSAYKNHDNGTVSEQEDENNSWTLKCMKIKDT